VRANAPICLIHQANYLPDQQIAAAEKRFVEEGGYSEQLAAARLAERQKKHDRTDRSDPSDPSDHIPHCPRCGMTMVVRTVKAGTHAGKQFWGCSAYPACKGAVDF